MGEPRIVLNVEYAPVLFSIKLLMRQEFSSLRIDGRRPIFRRPKTKILGDGKDLQRRRGRGSLAYLVLVGLVGMLDGVEWARPAGVVARFREELEGQEIVRSLGKVRGVVFSGPPAKPWGCIPQRNVGSLRRGGGEQDHAGHAAAVDVDGVGDAPKGAHLVLL